MTYRIFHATGPGNIIEAHKFWSRGQHYPREVSITFSSQFEDFCRDVNAQSYIVACPNDKAIYSEGAFTLEHRPKPTPNAKGLHYYIADISYGFGLLLTALQFRANLAVLDSGIHYFIMGLFPLAGIKTIVVLHSTLWPTGFPPRRRLQQLMMKLDSAFFRWLPIAIIGVSPECIRQVNQLTKGKHALLCQIRAQFRREDFQAVPAPSVDQRPFRIMYIGRIVRYKGVFDILEMAKEIESKAPGQVRWEICGTGPDLEAIERLREEMRLQQVLFIRGWTSWEDLRLVYARSHAVIVPTRSDYREGLAMTAAEAVLSGRPVITNSVVPALEVLRSACVEAQADDVDSYVAAILSLVGDPNQYRALCGACPKLQGQFYDRSQGLAMVLRKIIESQGAQG